MCEKHSERTSRTLSEHPEHRHDLHDLKEPKSTVTGLDKVTAESRNYLITRPVLTLSIRLALPHIRQQAGEFSLDDAITFAHLTFQSCPLDHGNTTTPIMNIPASF